VTFPDTATPVSGPRPATHGGWLAWLTAIACLPPLGLNLMIPLDRALATDLASTPAIGMAAIGLYALGLALGQPLAGYASDGWGRRPTLVTGLAIGSVGGLLASLATDPATLLAGRTLAGLGLSVSLVVPRAVLRDLAEGASLQRGMSVISTAFAVMPAVTPVVGWWLLARTGDWRFVMAVLPLLSLAALALAAPFHPETRRVGTFAPGLASLRAIWKHRQARSIALAFAAFGAVFFVLIGLVPAAVRGTLGADERFVALLMGGTFLGFLVGNAVVSFLASRHQPLVLCTTGCAIAGLGVALMCVAAARPSAVGWTFALLCYSLGHGMLFPTALTVVIQAMPTRAGLAAAMTGMAPMLAGGCAAMAAGVIPASAGSRLVLVCLPLVVIGATALRMAWTAPASDNHLSGDPNEATG